MPVSPYKQRIVRLRGEVDDALVSIATDQDVPVAQLIRQAVREYIDTYQTSNSNRPIRLYDRVNVSEGTPVREIVADEIERAAPVDTVEEHYEVPVTPRPLSVEHPKELRIQGDALRDPEAFEQMRRDVFNPDEMPPDMPDPVVKVRSVKSECDVNPIPKKGKKP